MPSPTRDTDLALPPLPPSDSGVRQRPLTRDTVESNSLPPAPPKASLFLVAPPRASLPPPRASLPPPRSSWVDDGATEPDAKPKAPPPPPKSLPPSARASLPPPPPSKALPAVARASLPPPPPKAKTSIPKTSIPKASMPKASTPPPPPIARKSAPPPPPSARPAASIPPPPPRARLARVIEVIGTKVDTLVGFDLTKGRFGSDSLTDQPALGPNPFGPPTAEVDLAPYLRKTPIDVPPRLAAIAVIAVCFVLGSGLAVGAMGGPEVHAFKSDTKPPAFASQAEPEPIRQPRLTELYADAVAPSAPAVAIPEPELRRAVPDAAELEPSSRAAQLRARRQARRQARIRARYRARHGR